jgi:hypothetical protein
VLLASLAPAVTDFTEEALRTLRDPDQFNCYVVSLLGLVMYVYAVEIERRNWSVVLAGLAFWCVDWINEIVNALVLHFTDRAAIWTTTGDTAYHVLIGLNLEISFLFLIAGVVFVKQLPPDPATRILGVPNRLFLVLAFSTLCVAVEVLLWAADVFHWEYWWWNFPNVPLIILLGYATFFAAAAWVHDMRERSRQLTVVGTLAAIDVALVLAFGPILEWI